MPSDNIIIPNINKLEEAKKRIMADGPAKLHVVSDFDKTLTSCFVNGKKINSITSILRDENYLMPDYPEKARALFREYNPIELDLKIPLSEKKEKMHEWWSRHYDLLIKSKLRKKDIENAVKSKNLLFRKGAVDFLNLANQNKIPLLILSASGIGVEAIQAYFYWHNYFQDNIFIVSNRFIWDETGLMKGYEEPIIHSFNKDYKMVEKFPFYNDLKSRKNVILMGDSIGDVSMTDGFTYDNIIRIGFLNERTDEYLEAFKKSFDVIILNDGPMDYVNSLLKDIITNQVKR